MRPTPKQFEYRVRIDRSFNHPGFDVWITRFCLGGDGKLLASEHLLNDKWLPFGEGGFWPEPTHRWPVELLKTFGLALGESNLVHQDLVFNSKELAATRFHLEDMRRLVFKEPHP